MRTNRSSEESQRRSQKKWKKTGVLLFYGFLCILSLLYVKVLSRIPISLNDSNVSTPYLRIQQDAAEDGSCAILLFGLPRAFRDFVLPSLETNVIRPNRRYNCDFFVHYYDQTSEASGRSGQGGVINVDDIFLLKESVHRVHDTATSNNHRGPQSVTFVSDTNETFWRRREAEIMKYRHTKNSDGKYAYFPYEEATYEYPGTLDNIVKQWHSINAVWDAMENHPKKYDRVAMMRNDVVYLTPIDIYSVYQSKGGKTSDRKQNRVSVIPDFAKWPVNDRMIYGPYDAVKIWASQRFQRIDDYAKDPHRVPGKVMHSETFLNASILESIKHGESSTQSFLVMDPTICFLRVRADGAIWIEDCDASKSGFGGGYPGGMKAYRKLLEKFLPKDKECKKRRLVDMRVIYELFCHDKKALPSHSSVDKAKRRSIDNG